MKVELSDLRDLAGRSTCDKLKFGAICVNGSGQIVGVGWNHNPNADLGWICEEDCAGGIREGVRSGTRVECCHAVHAEQHAVVGAENPKTVYVAGWRPDGTLFDNSGGFYCTVCARIMAATGVETVVVFDDDGNPCPRSIEQAWDESYNHIIEP